MTPPMSSTPMKEGGETVVVALPWPDRMLSPNARVHWSVKARATRKARTEAWLLVGSACRKPGWPAAHISMTFCPPDKRRRDRDNCIGSMKAATDGIADALGIDDSKFQTTYSMAEPVKGGAVIVTIRGIE
jgi:crossover junction endodeoxyribonuclease RusA